MARRLLASRGFMSVLVVLTLIVATVIGFRLARPHPAMRGYCAEMPDSIGLYVGSAVTVLGVPVGEVTEIRSTGATAHVRFTIPAERRLPADVGAVTLSDTLIADRKLALVGNQPPGPGWNTDRCITKTLTPQSLSQTFDALGSLAAHLRADDQRTGPGALEALARATDGTAEKLNTVIWQLSQALAAPDAAVAHLGALLDTLAELAHKATRDWAAIESTVSGLPQAFIDINDDTIPPIRQLVDNLAEVLPQTNDVIMMFGSPGLRALDQSTDLARLFAARIGSLAEILRMTPAILTAFTTVTDPATGAISIDYAPPALRIPHDSASALCQALATVSSRACEPAEHGTLDVAALPLLLAAVSTR
ncbi:MlaD family protein [Nocardia bovistercoris]|uniref:MCE family protein n=1 Tax=Nocardia bovistercoris TaxID=2785916 RepID=A0A931IFN0_9NOCA|nr:MlaD family protein [Nocardia bovistercoris]MBH0780654.1 MCE family protein [Nocardia bovistercoris]